MSMEMLYNTPGTKFNYNGTFAAVKWFETLCIMLALTAVNGWNMCQLDGTSA